MGIFKSERHGFKTKTKIDENGRVCTGECKKYLPWKNEDGTTNFPKNNQSKTGYAPKCKECLKKKLNKKSRAEHYKSEPFYFSDTGFSIFERRVSY